MVDLFTGLESLIALAFFESEQKSIKPSHSDPTETKPSFGGRLVTQVAFGAAGIFIGIIGAIPTAALWAFKKIRHAYVVPSARRTLKEEYATKLLKNLLKVDPYKPELKDIYRPDYQGYKEFKTEVEKFAQRLNNGDIKDFNEIRREIVRLKNLPAYRQLKDKADLPEPARFLQDCGKALETTDGTEIFSKYGEAKAAKVRPDFNREEEVSLTGVANILQAAREKKTFNRDKNGGITALAAYFITHIGLFYHEASAKTNPSGYDSYNRHSVFLSKPLVDGEHSIEHKYTPGLTGPSSIVEDVLLPIYKKEGRRWVHIDNQSTHAHASDERERVDLVHEMAERNPGVFLQAVVATDTPAEVAKQHIEAFEYGEYGLDGLENFLNDYESAIRGENDVFIRDYSQNKGIHISHELLNDAELAAVFQASKEMISVGCLEEGNKELLKTQAGRKELAQIAARNLSSLLEWAIMKKEQMTHEDSTFTVNCKENIDRGPMENLAVVVNDKFAQAEPGVAVKMTNDELNLQLGISLGRADFSSDRSPQDTRVDPALARMRFIDRSQDTARYQLRKLREMFLKLAPAPHTVSP